MFSTTENTFNATFVRLELLPNLTKTQPEKQALFFTHCLLNHLQKLRRDHKHTLSANNYAIFRPSDHQRPIP